MASELRELLRESLRMLNTAEALGEYEAHNMNRTQRRKMREQIHDFERRVTIALAAPAVYRCGATIGENLCCYQQAGHSDLHAWAPVSWFAGDDDEA